jgi:hypothetical protein
MSMIYWFAATAIGTALLGLSISVASRKGTIAAAILTVVGIAGAAYMVVDGQRSPPGSVNAGAVPAK